MASITIYLAQLLGPVFLILGVLLVLRAKMLNTMFDEIRKSFALAFTWSSLLLLGGTALLLAHSIWDSVTAILISIVGAAAILKAILFLAIPDPLLRFAARLKGAFVFGGVVWIVGGAWFSYVGFILGA